MPSPTTGRSLTPSTSNDTAVLDKGTLNFSLPEAQYFVTIIVGKAPTQVHFRIHKHVVAYYSPDFFGKAFNSTMMEGQTQSMELDDVEVRIFGFFSNWLYTQKLENENGVALSPVEHAKLWSLGQRFLTFGLRDECLRNIEKFLSDTLKEIPSLLSQLQNYAYVEAPQEEGSALRKIVLAKTLHLTNTENMDEMLAESPKIMILDFAKALLVRKARLSAKIRLLRDNISTQLSSRTLLFD